MIGQFCDAMRAVGIEPPAEIIADGRIHRFGTDGKRGDDAGWYALFGDDIPGGAFGDWRSGVSQTWRANIGRKLSPEEEEAHRRRMEEVRRRREAEEKRRHAEAAEAAKALLDAATGDPATHPYAVRKAVPFGRLVKRGYWPQRDWSDALLVPIYATNGQLITLEAINADGEKDFLTGGRKRGGVYPIGKISGAKQILIGEGLATVAAAHRATGIPAIAAMDSSNLEHATRAIKEFEPNAAIIIVADNDIKPDGSNPGIKAATKAARAISARMVIPELEGRACDFWDLWHERGAEAVAQAIANAKAFASTCSDGQAQSEGQAWPDSRDLPGGLLPVPSLQESMIPEPLRPCLSDVARRMQCPLEFPAVGAIIELASIVGRKLGIRPKRHDDWTVVPNLWGGAVGRPGIMKTPALEEMMKPLRRLELEACKTYENEMNAFETQKVVLKAKKEDVERRIKEALRKGEGADCLAAELSGLKIEEPKPVRYIVNDPTVEKLGELLNQNPQGLLLFRDELIGWLRTLDREGHENDRAFYMEAWNGSGSYIYDRIGRGTLHIEAVCVSILGGIQPGPLGDYLRAATTGGKGADGLMQRFQLLVYPDDPGKWKNVDVRPDTAAKNRAFEIFKKLADPRTFAGFAGDSPGGIEPQVQGEREIPFLRFASDAQECFDNWRGDLENKIRSGDEHPVLEAHLSKYRNLMPSLALLFHLVEVVDGKPHGPVSNRAALMAAAWCDFLEAHARRIYQSVTQHSLVAANLLAKKITGGRLPNPFTGRDVYNNGWSGLSTPEDVEKAAEILEEAFWIRSKTVQTGGRPKVQYRINPKLGGGREAD